MDLVDIYRVFHSIAVEHTFFSAANEIFSKTDNILGHETHLHNYKN
jgi:hypothetical protein